jgi:hypothetical protein
MRSHSSAFLVLLISSACASDGAGDLVVRVSGEDAAKHGLPLEDDGETIAFADGWSLQFSKYLVAIADVTLTSSSGDRVEDPTVYVTDLHLADADIARFDSIAAVRWDGFSFAVRGPAEGDEVETRGSVAEADLAAMQAGGYDMIIAGTATKDERVVTFEWALANPSRNRDCTNGTDGSSGVIVRNNTVADAEITFHVEHMFWDTLGSEQNTQRFEAIAAMADDDGVIAFEDLRGQRLADLRDAEGETLLDEQGMPLVYNPGSVPVDDLREFILAATRTEAHLNGEGLCTIEPL